MQCLLCNKELTASNGGDDQDIIESNGSIGVFDGINVNTPGNYGSSLLDCQDGILHFAICDKCLMERLDRTIMMKDGKVVTGKDVLRPTSDDKATAWWNKIFYKWKNSG